ncbi:MAG TPA: MucR family transcriptional regulator [Candidatus Cybelea sp.]|nr:MucR family transcriptional regulator [Candidatus Cybelea sp.]
MADGTESGAPKGDLLRMTAEIVSAYVSHNEVATPQITDIIKAVHGSLDSLHKPMQRGADAPTKPAIPVRRSITPDYIVCLEDGKKLKMLKRYLRSTYSLTPEEYRSKWGLPADYPMVAPNYAKQRSAFAKKIGLGRKGRAAKIR